MRLVDDKGKGGNQKRLEFDERFRMGGEFAPGTGEHLRSGRRMDEVRCGRL